MLESLGRCRSHESILAVDRGVVNPIVCFSVEICNFSAVGEIVADVVESVRLDTGGEGSHLLRDLFSGVPDDTLDKTLATSDRVEVDLGGRGLELHGVFP